MAILFNFIFGSGFETSRTNSDFFSVYFPFLDVNGESSLSGDIGMGAALGGFGTAAAYLTDSGHKNMMLIY